MLPDTYLFCFFLCFSTFPLFSPHLKEIEVNTVKKLISTSKRGAIVPFAGLNSHKITNTYQRLIAQ